MRFGPRLYTVVRLQQGPVRGPEFVVGELARLVGILANRKGGHLQSARKLRSGNVRIQEPTRFSKDSEVADGRVRFLAPRKQGANTRKAGEDAETLVRLT